MKRTRLRTSAGRRAASQGMRSDDAAMLPGPVTESAKDVNLPIFACDAMIAAHAASQTNI